jgi:hypothetical protein
MKTKKDFLENYASNPDLARKTLNAGGLTWEDIKEMKWDAYAADTGAVPGMIYYADTVKFAKRNQQAILDQLRQFEEEAGQLDVPRYSDGETQYFNWFAWFAWENTIYEVLNYLEEDEA